MRPKSITVTEPTETMKLVEFVNQNGLKSAAEKYGCDPSTLSRWLRVQGYELIRQYRKVVTAVEAVQA